MLYNSHTHTQKRKINVKINLLHLFMQVPCTKMIGLNNFFALSALFVRRENLQLLLQVISVEQCLHVCISPLVHIDDNLQSSFTTVRLIIIILRCLPRAQHLHLSIPRFGTNRFILFICFISFFFFFFDIFLLGIR